jgi:hypothetical protein
MSGPADRPLDDLGPGHREAQKALPWLANGTLAGAELERVRSHLQGCAACRADLAVLHTLRAAGSVDDSGCDPERALARLLPRLDEAAVPPATPAPSAASAATADDPVPLWRERSAANDRSWKRAAIAAHCCVTAVLAVLLAGRHGSAGGEGGAYHALGAGKPAAARMAVVFRPDTPERELRRIVRANGAHIVGGPTVTDAYLLDTDGAPASVLAGLRAEAAVTLAEPLGEPPAQESRP